MSVKITNITGIGSTTASVLVQYNFKTVAAIAHAEIEALSAVPGFSAARAENTINAAKQLLDSTIAGQDASSIVAGSGQVESKKAKKDRKKKDKKAKGKNKDKKKNKKHKKKNKKKNKSKKKNKKGK